VHHAVDEQGGGAEYLARGQAAVDVALDPLEHGLAGPVAVERCRVQAELDGVPAQVAVFECVEAGLPGAGLPYRVSAMATGRLPTLIGGPALSVAMEIGVTVPEPLLAT
jgi:hypothetical protein